MKRVVVVILDGMRRDLLSAASTPCLEAFRARAEWFDAHRSVFPSATRVASASVATGCHPARHELQGNTLALLEDGAFVRHDTGAPDFLQHKRLVTGSALAVPTLAERVKMVGGAITFSNASPGAAYAQDPDGHGFLYNRGGSFGPGRVPVPATDELRATPDLDGDESMTRRFISDALGERCPALAVLWLHEPDHLQHAVPLGSPRHLAALRRADAHVGLVIQAVDRLRHAGQDVLLIVGSDHGHHTVGVVDIDAQLIAAGLKDTRSSGDVVSASSGTSALVYVHPRCAGRMAALGEFLASRDWAGRVVPREALAEVGQASRHGLAFAVALRAEEHGNAYGVPGVSLEALPSAGKSDHLGFGQHGGLGAYEQSPLLMVDGPGFTAGATRRDRTSIVDIAPTVLRHLGLPDAGTDGHGLQRMNTTAGGAPPAQPAPAL